LQVLGATPVFDSPSVIFLAEPESGYTGSGFVFWCQAKVFSSFHRFKGRRVPINSTSRTCVLGFVGQPGIVEAGWA
jgi:hypothetical protein